MSCASPFSNDARTVLGPCQVRSCDEQVVEDEAYRISTARVVLVDYARLLGDFAQLRPSTLLAQNPVLGSLSESARTELGPGLADEWLLHNAAMMSVTQTKQLTVNTTIRTCGSARKVARPPLYGRACKAGAQCVSVHVEDLPIPVHIPAGGELDIKGVGVRDGVRPGRGDHSNGLLPLHDAIQEYLVERFIGMVFAHAGAAVRTLPHYAVLDTGFDGIDSEGRRFPAGLVVRRAHSRNSRSDLPNWNTQDQYKVFGIELLLRRYGLTSAKRDALQIREVDGRLVAFQFDKAAEYSHESLKSLVEALGLAVPFEAEGVNIQMDFNDELKACGCQVVDFGQYRARRRFERALVSLVCDRPLGWGGMIVPTDRCFLQPEPRLVPEGRIWEDACQPDSGLFSEVAAEIVADFRRGTRAHGHLNSQISALLADMVRRWPRNSAGTAPHLQ